MVKRNGQTVIKRRNTKDNKFIKNVQQPYYKENINQNHIEILYHPCQNDLSSENKQ
jgi:hypothetical protein